MGLYDNFPYTNTHELNTDWIVKKIGDIDRAVDSSEASAEAAKASAEDAAEHQEAAALSAEAAAGSAADAQEDADRIEAAADQIELNTQRIDNILVQGTPTEGNAELIDIRVGADGVTYPTAGDAVRGQYTRLRDTDNTIIANLDGIIEDIEEDITDTLTPVTGFYGRNSYTLNTAATTYRTYTIDCLPGQRFHFIGYMAGGSYDNTYAYVRYLDGSGHLISDIGTTAGNSNIDITVTAPANCFKITLTNAIAMPRPFIFKKDFEKNEYVYNIAKGADELENLTSGNVKASEQLNGFYSPKSLTFNSNTSYFTEVYKVIPGEELYINTKANGGQYVGTLDLIRYYDSTRTCFCTDVYPSAAGDNVLNGKYTVPNWASYAYIVHNADARIQVSRKAETAIFIGDSYTQAVSLPGAGLDQSMRFSSVICRKYGLVEKNFAVGGTGFDTSSPTFEAQLDNAIADNSYNHAEVKYIFICGGRNDVTRITVDLIDINTIVKSVIRKAHTNYPAAKIIMIPMLWDNVICNQAVFKSYTALINACSGEDCTVIPNAYSWLTGMKACILADNVHPNVEGHALIADHITDSLETGYYYPYTKSVSLNKVSANIDTDPTHSSFATIINTHGKLIFNSTIYITGNTGRWEELFSYTTTDGNDPFLFGNYGHSIYLWNKDTNTLRPIIFTNTYTDGQYKINCNVDGTALTPGVWTCIGSEILFGFEPFAAV